MAYRSKQPKSFFLLQKFFWTSKIFQFFFFNVKKLPRRVRNVQKLLRSVRKRPETFPQRQETSRNCAPQGQKRQETAAQGQAVKLGKLAGGRGLGSHSLQNKKKIGKKKKNFFDKFYKSKNLFFVPKKNLCSKSSKTSKKSISGGV